MGAAAAVILMREREIVAVFERAGATDASHARAPADIGVDMHGVGFRRLHDRAVVRESAPGSGRFYLDSEVWQAVGRMRRRIVAIMFLVIIAGLVVLLLTNKRA